ncbi:MAG: DUF5683 domain-containing protein [Cyclonatronaceae bacterium]
MRRFTFISTAYKIIIGLRKFAHVSCVGHFVWTTPATCLVAIIGTIILIASIPAATLAGQDQATKEDKGETRITSADLRLSPVLPGPRYVTSTDMEASGWNSGFMHTLGTNPGFAMLASAIVPGLGQAANRQWWKTALFVAAEATTIGIYIHRENRGRDGERYYEEFGNQHWSVVQYAQYLVQYHGDEHGKTFQDLLTSKGMQQYTDGEDFGGIDPAFDINVDWDLIDISALRSAERNSYYATGFAFSHDLPDYGSQQYYELMSKYFQFGPGWREWDISRNDQYSIDDGTMPDQFWYHAQIGYDFNNDLRVANNMLTLLVVNHFVAALDAYFTQQLRKARVQPTASMEYGLRPTLGFHLRF